MKNNNLIQAIIKGVGGKENIKHVAHCATRLRFNLVDEKLANEEILKGTEGILGITKAGGQFQVIIGQSVNKVYEDLMHELGDYTIKIEGEKPKVSILSTIMDALSGSLTPAISVLTVAAFFKVIPAIFGPDMLNMMSENGDLFTLFTFVGDAGFYFFPVVLGYTASTKFKTSPLLGILLGAIMLHPTFVGMANEGVSFKIFGIPTLVQNYANTVLPIILSVWVMSYVEKFFEKVIPDVLKSLLVPSLTILVMLPLSLSVIGPLGAVIGSGISNGLLNLQKYAGFLGVALIGALFPLLILTGMHIVLITALIQVFMENGSESFVAVGLAAFSFAVMGMALGAALRIKNKEDKSLAFGYFLTAILAGVSEPAIYGLGIRYKKPMIGLMSGGFAGGLFYGIMKAGHYTLIPLTNVVGILAFTGNGSMNFINGVIGALISFGVAAVVTYTLGISEEH